MIIRSAAVLAFCLGHILATDAGPQVRSGLDYTLSSSFPIPSVVPTATERPLLLATNHSWNHQHQHSNSTQHSPGNATHNSTSILRNPTATRRPLPGQTLQPGPVPGIIHNSNQASSKRPNVAQIFFEVIGGIAGMVVLLALLRCIYVYKRTPTNRSSPEVREIDRTLALLRTVPWRPAPVPPPPPPYQPAPEYAAVPDIREEEWRPQPPDRSHDPARAERAIVSHV